ncbi:MAG: DUF5615 family PIN-like protein [Planctomycetes bacterium]|nr:DUF5615 family PIN-like protein [Planctomycetota bacterium]
MKFVIDEDMSRSLSKELRAAGHETLDVRDHGLRGKSDSEVYDFAQAENAVLVTGDLGFGNILNFPIGKNRGIVIVHFPNNISANLINREVIAALDVLSSDEVEGSLIIIHPGKVRIRKK